jgi:hypothetical protein
MPSCLEGMGVALGALEERPFMIADDVCYLRGIEREAVCVNKRRLSGDNEKARQRCETLTAPRLMLVASLSP